MAEEYGPNAFPIPEEAGGLELCGGTRIMTGGEETFDFGWRRSLPEDLTGAVFAEHDPNENVPIKLDLPLIDLTAPARSAFRGPIPYNWQLTGSCFPPGTPVRMGNGSEKPIEDVKVGDEVLTHTGQIRKVVNTMTRKYTGEMVTVKAEGHDRPLQATADHPFAVWRDGTLVWVNATELNTDDRVLVSKGVRNGHDGVIDVESIIQEGGHTRPDKAAKRVEAAGVDAKEKIGAWRSRFENWVPRKIPVTPSLARLVGLYLAEGGIDAGRVTFTFNKKEMKTLARDTQALLRGVFGAESTIGRQKGRKSVVKVRCSNVNVAAVMAYLVPGGLYTKRAPGLLMHASLMVRQALLKGWMDGDGSGRMSRSKRDGWVSNVSGVSASKGLASDMETLAASCGHLASFTRRKPRKQSREAFDVHLAGDRGLGVFPALQRQAAKLGVSGTCLAKSSKLTPFGIARKVKKLTRTQVTELQVYDFEVEEDHSFVADGLVVHNCVQGGFFNALVNRIGVEIALGGQAEVFDLPFTLFSYGVSRWMAYRDKSPGEGSAGSAIVAAAEAEGIPSFNDPDAPKPSILRSIDGRFLIHVYTRAQELQFSGISGHPAGMKERVRPVKLKYIRCRSADAALIEMQRGRPLTWAGTWGGLNRPPVAGGNRGPKVLLNRHASSWSHQESCSIVWDHPDLRRIWNINNQWFGPGPDSEAEYIRTFRGSMISRITKAGSVVSVHGDPVDPYSPLGSFYVSDADMNWQCKNGEVFAIELIGGYSGDVGTIGI